MCQIAGIPEWKAEDEFQKQGAKDVPWLGARGDLRLHLMRVKKWWQRDGGQLYAPTKGINGKPVGPSIISKDLDRRKREIENFNTDLPE